MSAELVFNELSLAPPAASLSGATQRMSQFLGVLAEISAQAGGAKPTLRTSVPLNAWVLAPEYPLSRWRNEPSVDREVRLRVLSVQANSPAVQEEAEPALADRARENEYLHEGQPATGLGLAYLLDGLAVSLPIEPWNVPRVEVCERSLQADNSLRDRPVVVRHASCTKHVAEHGEWLRPVVELVDGQDLWRRSEGWFPSLQFCASVEAQLAALDRGHPLLMQIYKRLKTLDAYAAQWKAGVFQPDTLGNVSRSSETALKKYREQYTFKCPDDNERLFSWHARLAPGAWRLHFAPEGPGAFFIGYIGAHLPTAKY